MFFTDFELSCINLISFSDENNQFSVSKMTDKERSEMIEKIDSNEIMSIKVSGIAFGDVANSNLVRPTPGNMGKIASRMSGIPFIKMHKTYDSESVIGDISDGRVVNTQGFDEVEFDAYIREPNAMKNYVRGLMRSTSIRLGGKKPRCSICNAPSSRYGSFQCSHELGTVYEKDGKEVLCEIFFDDPVPVELSSVVVGAYGRARVYSSNETDGGVMEETEEKKDVEVENSVDQSKEIHELQAKLEASEAMAFSLMFDNAVKERKVIPLQRSFIEKYSKKFGLSFFEEFLSCQPKYETLGMIGTTVSNDRPTGNDSVEKEEFGTIEDVLSFAEKNSL